MSNFVIHKDQINNCCVTVSERSELINPYFLVVFTSKFDTDGDTRSVSVQNSAPVNIRYDILEITEKTSPDPLAAEVYFPVTGEWSYKVYESETQTTDVADTTGRILQRGFIFVKE